MIVYLLKRMAWSVPVIIGVSLIVFIGIHLAPGDPAQLLLGARATPETLEQMRKELGLNNSIFYQFIQWFMHLARGDFGRSIVYRQDVLELVMGKFLSTASLGASALMIALPIGTFMGIIGAVKQNKWIDKCFMTFSYAGISMPIFWLGMLLILLFSQTLGWLPSSGMHSPTGSGFGDVLKHLILPAFTLSLVPMSVVARMMRSAMLEVIHQDYIRTARAKGCSPFRVIVSHALRNSMIPVVTIFGIEAGYVIGGTVIVETVFSWPGVGQMLLNSILSRDFPLVVGGTLILAVIFVGINIIVDLLYNLIDPRIELKS